MQFQPKPLLCNAVLKLLRPGGAGTAASRGASHSDVLMLGAWTNDISTRHYVNQDATSQLPTAWKMAGWPQVQNGFIYSQYRDQVEVPADFLDILGAPRLQKAIDDMEVHLQPPQQLKNKQRLYIKSLQDILKTDLHLMKVFLRDVALMVRLHHRTC